MVVETRAKHVASLHPDTLFTSQGNRRHPGDASAKCARHSTVITLRLTKVQATTKELFGTSRKILWRQLPIAWSGLENSLLAANL